MINLNINKKGTTKDSINSRHVLSIYDDVVLHMKKLELKKQQQKAAQKRRQQHKDIHVFDHVSQKVLKLPVREEDEHEQKDEVILNRKYDFKRDYNFVQEANKRKKQRLADVAWDKSGCENVVNLDEIEQQFKDQRVAQNSALDPIRVAEVRQWLATKVLNAVSEHQKRTNDSSLKKSIKSQSNHHSLKKAQLKNISSESQSKEEPSKYKNDLQKKLQNSIQDKIKLSLNKASSQKLLPIQIEESSQEKFEDISFAEIQSPTYQSPEQNEMIDFVLDERLKQVMKKFLDVSSKHTDKSYLIQKRFIEQNQREKKNRHLKRSSSDFKDYSNTINKYKSRFYNGLQYQQKNQLVNIPEVPESAIRNLKEGPSMQETMNDDILQNKISNIYSPLSKVNGPEVSGIKSKQIEKQSAGTSKHLKFNNQNKNNNADEIDKYEVEKESSHYLSQDQVCPQKNKVSSSDQIDNIVFSEQKQEAVHDTQSENFNEIVEMHDEDEFNMDSKLGKEQRKILKVIHDIEQEDTKTHITHNKLNQGTEINHKQDQIIDKIFINNKEIELNNKSLEKAESNTDFDQINTKKEKVKTNYSINSNTDVNTDESNHQIKFNLHNSNSQSISMMISPLNNKKLKKELFKNQLNVKQTKLNQLKDNLKFNNEDIRRKLGQYTKSATTGKKLINVNRSLLHPVSFVANTKMDLQGSKFGSIKNYNISSPYKQTNQKLYKYKCINNNSQMSTNDISKNASNIQDSNLSITSLI